SSDQYIRSGSGSSSSSYSFAFDLGDNNWYSFTGSSSESTTQTPSVALKVFDADATGYGAPPNNGAWVLLSYTRTKITDRSNTNSDHGTTHGTTLHQGKHVHRLRKRNR